MLRPITPVPIQPNGVLPGSTSIMICLSFQVWSPFSRGIRIDFTGRHEFAASSVPGRLNKLPTFGRTTENLVEHDRFTDRFRAIQ